MKRVRIGCGAGFANDRVEPAVEQIEKGELDYIMFECLGERTVAWAMQRKKHNPDKGYDEQLEYRMGKLFDAYKRTGSKTKIVSNMGAANPIGAAKVIVGLLKERGLGHMKVAAVVGDDVLSRLDKYMRNKTMETEQPLESIKGNIVCANAYIGCASIIEALKAGADIVVTGRAADPSLVVGPLAYEFGWALDDWDLLGKATIAGHLLECSAQVSGGFFADPGYKKVPDIWRIGFPICNFYENGDLEITKVEGSGGLVSEMTVKEQLLYELQDPSAYITPDVIADFTQVEVKELAPNLVRVVGGRGKPKTGFLKINVGYNDCYIGEGEVTYGGHSAIERARLGADTVLKRLELCGIEYSEIRVDLIGVNSLFGDRVGFGMTTGKNSEVRLRVAARTKDAWNADRVGYEVETLLVCGPQSAGGARRSVREIISLASILIDEQDVTTENIYYGGGSL